MQLCSADWDWWARRWWGEGRREGGKEGRREGGKEREEGNVIRLSGLFVSSGWILSNIWVFIPAWVAPRLS